MGTPGYVIRVVTASDAAECARLLTVLGYPVDAETVAVRLERFAAVGERALVADAGTHLLGLTTMHETPVLHRAGYEHLGYESTSFRFAKKPREHA